jgi:phage terminase Nu1 subunit (DNA packaging protein)
VTRATGAYLASRARVAERTVTTWQSEGMPRGDETEAAWWIVAHYKKQIDDLKTRKSASETELRSRKLLADAETAEEKLAILRGQHVPVEAVEDALSQFATALKSCLRGLHQLARRLHGKSTAEASQILRQVGNEILHELAALRFTRKQRDRDPDGPPDAA